MAKKINLTGDISARNDVDKKNADDNREYDKLLAGVKIKLKNTVARQPSENETSSNEKHAIDSAIADITGKPGIFAQIDRSQLRSAPEEWNKFTILPVEKRILMTESIYANGLLQPIVVRAINKENTIFQILAGHNRNECYNILREITGDTRYDKIDAKIFWYGEINDDQAKEIISDTNFIQRANLPIKDRAFCISNKVQTLKNKGLKHNEILANVAEKFEIGKTTVFYWQKLVNLIPEFDKMFSEGKITLITANKIASFPAKVQNEMYKSGLVSNHNMTKIKAKTKPEEVIGKLREISELKTAVQTIEKHETRDYISLKISPKPDEGQGISVFCAPKKIIEKMQKQYAEYLVK